MDIIHDTLDNVARHLCYIDLLSLSIASPSIRKYVRKDRYDINKIIQSRLSGKFGNLINAKSFIEELIKYNNYISGSFILQCLYNCEWKNSDIDVYCMSKESFITNSYGIIIAHIEEDVKTPLNFLWFLFKHKFECIENAHTYEEMHLMQRMYNLDNIMINYIMVNPTPIYESINTRPYSLRKTIHHDTIFKFVDFSFDLEVCKVIYDGSRLYIKNIESLFKRECKINLDLDKYIRRSFHGGGISDEELIIILRNRVEKYEQRGFKILCI
jgi:hypothetical protein